MKKLFKKKLKKISRKIIKKTAVQLILLTGGALAGLFALILVYAIPTAPMREHIYQSLPMMQLEFGPAKLIDKYPGSLTGSYTDCLMLENAIYQSEKHTLLEQILHMYRKESGTGNGWAPGYSLIDYVSDIPQPREVEYARYWHGYLVVLKPLIFLTNFNTIRVMASALQLILVGIIVMACCKRKEYFLGMAFLVSVPFFYYFGLYASLSLSICFYLMTGLILTQLKWDMKLRKYERYGEFFLVAGMMTSYFDFLTYPLVTLGFPLCVYLYLDKNNNVKHSLKFLVGYSAEWGCGYLGFWALKWGLTDILTKSNTIKDGLQTVLIRTHTAAGRSRIAGFFTVIKLNAGAYLNLGFYILILGIFIWLAGLICRKRKNFAKEIVWEGALLFIIAFYPFIWFFLVQNHSEEHWMFTCKIFALTVFAGVCGIGKLCGCGAENPMSSAL